MPDFQRGSRPPVPHSRIGRICGTLQAYISTTALQPLGLPAFNRGSRIRKLNQPDNRNSLVILLAGSSGHMPDSYLDLRFVFQQSHQFLGVGIPVVVWIQDARFEGPGGISHHRGGHGIGQVHGKKSDVDTC